MSFSNLPYVGDGESLALFDVKVHVLPDGCGFHMSERKPFCAKAGADKDK
jgi:cyanophycinase-like exopeptidase